MVRQAVERAGERVQSGGVRQVRVGVATTLDKKKSYRQPGGNDLPTRAVNRRPRSFGIAAKYKCRSMLMRKIEQTCFTIIFLIRNLQLYMFNRRTEKAPCKFARAASPRRANPILRTSPPIFHPTPKHPPRKTPDPIETRHFPHPPPIPLGQILRVGVVLRERLEPLRRVALGPLERQPQRPVPVQLAQPAHRAAHAEQDRVVLVLREAVVPQ